MSTSELTLYKSEPATFVSMSPKSSHYDPSRLTSETDPATVVVTQSGYTFTTEISDEEYIDVAKNVA